MMKYISTTVFAFAAASIAAPALEPKALALRDDPPKTHLYICKDAAFKGECANLEVAPGQCYNVPDNFNDQISSLGPDEKTFCSTYTEYNCSGKAFPFTYPGIWDLAHYAMSDVISSYRCDYLGGFDHAK